MMAKPSSSCPRGVRLHRPPVFISAARGKMRLRWQAHKLLTWGQAAGVDYELVGLLWPRIEYSVSCSTQERGVVAVQATWPPSQPFARQPGFLPASHPGT